MHNENEIENEVTLLRPSSMNKPSPNYKCYFPFATWNLIKISLQKMHSTQTLKFSPPFNVAVAASHLSTPFAIFVVSRLPWVLNVSHKFYISGTHEQEQPSIYISSNNSCKVGLKLTLRKSQMRRLSDVTSNVFYNFRHFSPISPSL
jgi:hypothetical protein